MDPNSISQTVTAAPPEGSQKANIRHTFTAPAQHLIKDNALRRSGKVGGSSAPIIDHGPSEQGETAAELPSKSKTNSTASPDR